MIKVNEIKGRIVAKGMTQSELAEMLGITMNTLRTKFQKGVFDSDEIEKMIKILDFENPYTIFFADDVAYKVTKK